MKCSNCKKDFEEKDIQESHDVPCYLFFLEGKTRKEKKHYADKYPRRWLCKGCHDIYERELCNRLIIECIIFSKDFSRGTF